MRKMAGGDGIWIKIEYQGDTVESGGVNFRWLGRCSGGWELFFDTRRRTRAKPAYRESMKLGELLVMRNPIATPSAAHQ
jgi:hypothetical protein